MNYSNPLGFYDVDECPSFATPFVSCGNAPHTSARMSSALGFIGPRPLVEHCGGCGFKHERRDLTIKPTKDIKNALAQIGRKQGHVAYFYDDNMDYVYVAAGNCCRDTEWSARWAHPAERISGYYAEPFATEADIAAEEWSEKMYASSYGLGL